MSRTLTVLAVVWTILLAGILYELHGLNRRLDTTGAAATDFAKGAATAVANWTKPETEAERKARIQSEVQRGVKDFRYALGAPDVPRDPKAQPHRDPGKTPQ